MHDIKIIRTDSEKFKKKILDRNIKIDIKNLISLDEKYRLLIQKKEKLEQEKKIISQKKDKTQFQKSKELSIEIDKLNEEETNFKNKIEYHNHHLLDHEDDLQMQHHLLILDLLLDLQSQYTFGGQPLPLCLISWCNLSNASLTSGVSSHSHVSLRPFLSVL